MPTYTIEGKRIKTDAPLSDADIDEIASSLKVKAPAPKPTVGESLAAAYQMGGPYAGVSSPGYRTVVGTGLTDPIVAVRELTGTISPEAVRQREAAYQEEAARSPGAGFGRFMGGAISTAPLALMPGAPASMNMLGRMALGGATGAGAAMLTQPTTGEGDFWAQKINQADLGFGIGAAAPVVGAGVNQLSNLWALARNKLSPQVNAQNIVHEALGGDKARISQIQAANAAQPDVLASRIAAGVEPGSPAYEAVLRTGEKVDPSSAAWRAAEVAVKANQAELDALAKGANRTATKEARNAAYSAVVQDTEPMRAGVKAGTETTKEFETTVPVAGALGWNEIKKVAHTGVNVSDVLASIRKDIRGKPGVRASEVVDAAVGDVEKKLRQWADDRGFVNFEDLHTIRKEIGTYIAKHAKENKNWDERLAGGLQNSIQDYIDDAIVQSGGKKWPSYLETFATGARGVKQQKLYDELANLYRTNKVRFVQVVNGNDPDFVQSVLGSNKFNIAEELGSSFAPVRRIARDAEAELTAAGRASEGAAAVSGILARNQLNAAIPNFFSPKITLTKEVLSGLQGKVNAKTMRVLTQAVQSGANMNELLSFVPPGEKSTVAAALRGVAQAIPMPYSINMLTPMSSRTPANQNALAGQ